MKKTILLICLTTAYLSTSAQTCCKKSSEQDFAQLAMNEDFAVAHLEPLPFNEENPKGKEITFPVKGQNSGNAYVMMSDAPTKNWIIVYHEWWGLNNYIKKECDKFQNLFSNCNVIAIDLYDNKGADDIKTAQFLSSNLKDARVKSLINGALDFIGDDAQIVSIGWCMGGGWSLQSAWLEGKRAIGCVMFYGMPENDVEKLKKLPCDILGIFGSKDQFITPKMVAEFQTNLESAKIKCTIKMYNADHAFANPSNPKHNIKATNEAYEVVYSYLKEKFNN